MKTVFPLTNRTKFGGLDWVLVVILVFLRHAPCACTWMLGHIRGAWVLWIPHWALWGPLASLGPLGHYLFHTMCVFFPYWVISIWFVYYFISFVYHFHLTCNVAIYNFNISIPYDLHISMSISISMSIPISTYTINQSPGEPADTMEKRRFN